MKKSMLSLGLFLALGSSMYAQTFGKSGVINYKLHTDEPVNFEIKLANQKANCLIGLSVLAADNKKVLEKRIHFMKQNETVLNASVREGDYILKLAEHSGGCKEKNFELSLTRISGNFEQELNNDFQTANPMKELKYHYGYLQHYNDVDYFSFEIPAKGVVNFEFGHEKAKGFASYAIEVFDTNHNLVVKYVVRAGAEKLIRDMGLEKGKYFIRIKRNDSSSGIEHHQYTMAYSFGKNDNIEVLPNKTKADATLIPDSLYISGDFYVNKSMKSTDYDFYKYKATQGKYSLVYAHKPFRERTIITIYDEDENRVANFIAKGLKEKEYFDFELPKDTTIYIEFKKEGVDREKKELHGYKFGILKSK